MATPQDRARAELTLAERWALDDAGVTRCGDLAIALEDDGDRFYVCDRLSRRLFTAQLPLDDYGDGLRRFIAVFDWNMRSTDIDAPIVGLDEWYAKAEAEVSERLAWEADAREVERRRQAEDHARQLQSDGWMKASAISPRRPDFLWEPYISLGNLTLLGGDPGVGKSTVSLALTAWVTREMKRNVVVLSVEDDPESSIVPMLAKLGADLDRVLILPIAKTFVLDSDGLAKLDRALAEFGPLLVVIDPMTYFMGAHLDMHRANEVRSVMKELAARAAEHRAAILPLIHLNKGGQKALYRILGSVDFTAVVRSVLLGGLSDDEPERGRALIHIKCNNARLGEPIGFDLLHDADDPFKLPIFTWRNTDLTKADLEGSKPGRKPSQVKTARGIIARMLRDGPVDSRTVKAALEGAGISESTWKRAKKDLVVVDQAHPGGGGSASIWRLALLGEGE
jgi:hypothetical protein